MSETLDRRYLEGLLKRGVSESLTLEYKASSALSRDGKSPESLSKDASAMANSEGGRIIYGIVEDNTTHKPIRVDNGVGPEIDREWIEHILTSWIHPKIDGLKITPIELATDHYAYVVDIPQARSLAPHQAGDKRYYRRHNFKILPMEDYEVRDMMRRSTTPDIFIELGFHGNKSYTTFAIEGRSTSILTLSAVASNASPTPATYGAISILLDAQIDVIGARDFSRNDSIPRSDRLNPNNCYTRVFSEAGMTPIYRELPQRIGDVSFRFHAHDVSEQKNYFVGYSVHVPGCSRTQRGWLIVDKGEVELVME